jgi:hypothetical protein
MPQAILTSPLGHIMHVTSRPYELNLILTSFASEVGMTAVTLSRSKNLEAIEAGHHLQRLADRAEAAARSQMLLEPELGLEPELDTDD